MNAPANNRKITYFQPVAGAADYFSRHSRDGKEKAYNITEYKIMESLDILGWKGPTMIKSSSWLCTVQPQELHLRTLSKPFCALSGLVL